MQQAAAENSAVTLVALPITATPLSGAFNPECLLRTSLANARLPFDSLLYAPCSCYRIKENRHDKFSKANAIAR